jgi:hypothetical protein
VTPSFAIRLAFAGCAAVGVTAMACSTELADARSSSAGGQSIARDGTRSTASRVHPARPAAERPAPAVGQSLLFGEDDERIRSTLSEAPIEAVKKGSGGRSLAFKLTFRDGLSGYFKPEQTFAANWYSEIASYYLDRELGLGRVPPAIGRRIEWRELSPHAGEDKRRREVVVRAGSVRGSVVFWLADKPEPVELPRGWESWLRIDQRHEVSPFQALPDYRRALARGAKSGTFPELDPVRAAELSDLVVFDHLIGNIDRWSKDFVNVLTVGPAKQLVFLDNANGFEVKAMPSWLLAKRLAAVERFRKRTIDALRAFDRKKLEQRMEGDPLAPLLDAAQLEQLEERRAQVLEHVASLERRYGSDALPW